MLKHLKSSFAWQFAGGFVLGAIGLVTFQTAESTQVAAQHFAPTHEAR